MLQSCTNSCFYVKQRNRGKAQFLFFRSFLLVLEKLGQRLGTSLYFYEVLKFSCLKSQVVWQLVRKIVFIVYKILYIMFITNNHTLFPLWWKGNLVKHQKVSKYNDYDCSLFFLLNFSTNRLVLSRFWIFLYKTFLLL